MKKATRLILIYLMVIDFSVILSYHIAFIHGNLGTIFLTHTLIGALIAMFCLFLATFLMSTD